MPAEPQPATGEGAQTDSRRGLPSSQDELLERLEAELSEVEAELSSLEE